MKIKLKILIAVFVQALVSCHKNDIVVHTDEWEYRTWEIAAPIATVHAPLLGTLKKYVDFEGYFDTNDDGVLCIRYNYSKNISWMDIIGINDVLSSTCRYNFSQMSRTDEMTFRGSITHPIKLTTGGDDIKDSYVNEAVLTAGSLFISLSLPNNFSSCNVELTIPGMTKNGETFSRNFNELSPGSTHEFILPNLDGYNVKTDANHNLNIVCNFSVNGTDVSGELVIQFTLVNMETGYLSGYFGQVTKEPDFSITEIDFFDVLEFEGALGIKEGIDVEAKVTNWTGIPFQIAMNSIMFNNNKNNELLTEPFRFNVPAAIQDEYHQVVPAKQTDNTELANVEFETADDYPDMITFKMFGMANPGGNEGNENFTSKNNNGLAKVDLMLTIPLQIRFDTYRRKDTIGFDYRDLLHNDIELSRSIKDFDLNLEVNNGLPFNILLSMDAIDDEGNIVEKDVVNMPIRKSESNQNISIKLDQSQLDNFWEREVKNIILYIIAQTGTEDYVTIMSDDQFDIDVSVRFKSGIPFKLFE